MILIVKKGTHECWVDETNNINDVVCDTAKWEVIVFDTEAEMRDYIAEHNLVEVSDETY